MPVHFSVSVPNIVELGRTQKVWAKKSELPGIQVNLKRQMQNLRDICLPYQKEYAGNRVYKEAVSKRFGPGYGDIEAQALHGVIRHFKPRTVVEIGSGVSTYCMLAAAKLNKQETGRSLKMTCIDPYPSDMVRGLSQITLVPGKVQSTSLDLYNELGAGDLLFIDSSHVVAPGSDVNYLVLEVLPRLSAGVIVHFHDIFLPFDYDRKVLQTMFHWSETSLLRAFLIFNSRAEIVFCMSQLHYDCSDALKEVFPEYNPQTDTDGLADERYRSLEQPDKHFPASTFILIKP